MPLIQLTTDMEVPAEVLGELSKTVAQVIGKPETYVMVCVSRSAMMMSGISGKAVFAEVRSIGGLSAAVSRELAQKLCDLLDDRMGVSGDRIYINFKEIRASEWGWNSSLFG